MTRSLLTVVMAVAMVSVGCGGAAEPPAGTRGAEEGAAPAASRDQGLVDSTARIANEIEARPDQAVEILRKHGKTREEFERMLYDIAADPELSRAYQQALGR